MHRHRVTAAALMALACLAWTPADSARANPTRPSGLAPQQGEAEGWYHLAGTWRSEEHGALKLSVDGALIYGQRSGGHLQGLIDERGLITFTWINHNGDRGRGWFLVSSDGETLRGQWGKGTSNADGGDWVLVKDD